LLRPDVGPVNDQFLGRHGRKECERVILTSEFHTDLVIYYAIVGANLGQGTISLASVTAPRPKAPFSHDGAILNLELKESYRQQVKQDIGGIIDQYGLAGPAYLAAVRQLGIRYWLDWSRDDIFDLAAPRQ